VNSIDGALTRVTIASGHVVTVPSGAGIAAGDAVDLVIRPEKVVVDPTGLVDRSVIPGTLAHMVYTGAVTYNHVDIGGGAILIAMAPNPDLHDLPALGSPVALGFKPDNMLIFPRRAES
jgi:ABC-type Fe3+/spermidine/putrescine transport system ATPase subunit